MEYLYWSDRCTLALSLGSPRFRLHLLKNTIHLACIWLTVLCVFVQSVGAAVGGVLCLGCSDVTGGWGGISVTSAPCTPVYDCCAQPEDRHDSHREGQPGEGPPVPGTGTDSSDCGCFDITLKAHDGTLARAQTKIILSFSHVLVPVAAILATFDDSVDRPMWRAIRARAGPPSVRLLVPLARRTVLLN